MARGLYAGTQAQRVYGSSIVGDVAGIGWTDMTNL